MEPARAGNLLTHLSQVPDPRGRKGRRHSLPAMLRAIVCALLCGHRGYTGIAEWLHDQPADIWHRMGFTRRPPGLHCFRRLLMALDPAALDAALSAWISRDLGISDEAGLRQTVSIDGKVLRGSLPSHSRAVHLLAAVNHRTGCVLSQQRVAPDTNEHKAALQLLTSLVLDGTVIIGDAAFCQRDVCRQIVDSGGDYLFPVKGNQPALKRDIEQEFAASPAAFSPWAQRQRELEREEHSAPDKGHRRLEHRTVTTTVSLNSHVDWPHVAQVGRVVRERRHHGTVERETTYFVTSLSRTKADAARLQKLIRGHWGAIENGLHHVRDTTFDEDRCTISCGDAPQNLAALRNAALNWLRREGTGNLASRIRSFTRQSQRLFTSLHLMG